MSADVAGRITSLSFERDGFPLDLSADSDWRREIEAGRLRPDTRVTVHREQGRAQFVAAGEVSELREVFEERELRTPAGLRAFLLRLIEQAMGALSERIRSLEDRPNSEQRLAAQERRIAALEEQVRTLAAAGSATPPATAAAGTKRSATGEAAPPPPVPQERQGDGLDGYRRLLEDGHFKPRDFRSLFGTFAEARTVAEGRDNDLELAAEQTADALLVALSVGTNYLVVPGFAYASLFASFYRDRPQNPPLVTRLFEFEKGSAGLRLVRAAELRPKADGSIQLVRRGRLGGFSA